jgi:hypothetical protein
LSLPSSLLRPDPPVSTPPTDFPGTLVIPRVCARRPGLGCRRDLPCFETTLLPSVPSPLRREEEQRHPSTIPAPRGFPQQNNASAPPATQHQLPLGICLRRCSVRFMLWPAGLLALLDWSDLEFSSGRRGRIHPSLPEVGHPHPESGMTTPPFWLSDIIGGILYGRPLQLMCNKIQQNDYSVAFGWLVAWKIKTLYVAIGARVAL